jgi:prefoldin subunit 5
MVEEGKKEKKNEQVEFSKYQAWCRDTIKDRKRAISEEEATIEQLLADIAKYKTDAEKLAEEIAVHEADIATWTADIKAATTVRALEKDDYLATAKDYEESIEALKNAIAVLEKQAQGGASAFVQLKALTGNRMMPQDAQQMIDNFLQQDPEAALDVTAPEASAYEFQSHGIIEMLKKLLGKFIDEQTALQKAEANAQLEFELLMTDLKAEIGEATADMEEKKVIRAKKLQAKKMAEADLAETQAVMEADKKYLADVTATCETKASEFASRQKLRTEEISVLEQAIEIISSPEVSGAADEHLPSLMQKRSAALAQLRADEKSPVQIRVSQYLKDRAGQLNSRVLALISVRAADDPFKKVKKMIQDLIARLEEEAAAESEHKAWCDEQLSTNEATRKEKTEAVEMLHAEVDELEASIAKITEELADLAAAIAELDAAMKKATEIRSAEKAKNAATIADAVAAYDAVGKALAILKDFYAKAGTATALLQKASDPQIFESDADDSYKGMQGRKDGVVGLLEVIESDFKRLEAETKAAEEAAVKEHDEFMADSKADKEAKEADVEHKTFKKQDLEQEHVSTTEDLLYTKKELTASLAYYDKLKPSCINAAVSYEDRVAQRQEELASLQNALKILSVEDIA